MTESGLAHRPDIVARFWCDATHRVMHADGDLEHRLGYDTGALWGTEWRKVVEKDTLPVIATMGRDLSAGRVGAYPLTNISKHGDRLYLVTRTFALHSDKSVQFGGVTTLEAWDTPRTRIFLSAIQFAIYASQVLPVII